MKSDITPVHEPEVLRAMGKDYVFFPQTDESTTCVNGVLLQTEDEYPEDGPLLIDAVGLLSGWSTSRLRSITLHHKNGGASFVARVAPGLSGWDKATILTALSSVLIHLRGGFDLLQVRDITDDEPLCLSLVGVWVQQSSPKEP